MAISNNTILTKMMSELKKASAVNEQKAVREHIHAIRLLCDLLLEDKETDQDLELKKMIGDVGQLPNKKFNNANDTKTTTKVDHEEANGKSIFDF
ncbi:hypothetical protein GH741_15340 [Aquibacillus halophilus]|uniref:YwdI family protein n=1 Tax=Aquibacillus halophilus TaxID=930132 RepID=A0A6A8DHP0_9BACI|nr:YwdI family protein [Aquibacillus halophilus]MRH44016.1 hypothetical protein [Aquibacillus halophilus]